MGVGGDRLGGFWAVWACWIETTEYTKRGKSEVTKADRPQPRRGASAAANTRKGFE